MLRYLTAGESHGPAMAVILEGMVAGLELNGELINKELARRQSGYGRGGRMKIEKDKVRISSGLYKKRTIGSPVTLLIKNRDFKIDKLPMVLAPRPGHADLVGGLKYDFRDLRAALERSSARETVCRVAAGSVAKQFLSKFKVDILSYSIAIGPLEIAPPNLSITKLRKLTEGSALRVPDVQATIDMVKLIDEAKKAGNTLGGIFEVIVEGLPPGLGSYVQPDRRLGARLAAGLMSIPAIKGVEVGLGFECSYLLGSEVHDAIHYSPRQGYYRKTNFSGGLEGGVTTGGRLILRGAMKPISTLMKPLDSVNIKTKKEKKASVERSDVCAVPAAGVVAEAMVALELANAYLEKFGGDSISETKRNYEGYLKQVKKA